MAAETTFDDRMQRTAALIGAADMARVRQASVMVIGCGAVGGYALEMVARLGFGNRFQRKMRRNDRQIGEAPLSALDLILFRSPDFQKVPDCRRQDILIRLEIITLFGKSAETFRNVISDRRFFGDDECFGHTNEMRK